MIYKIMTLLVLLLAIGCSSGDQKKETSTNQVSSLQENNRTQLQKPLQTQFALFTLETIDGTAIHVDEKAGGLLFREFKDQIVMFVFFGYRCPPCLAEIPILTSLNNQKKSNLTIIGLEVQGLDSNGLKEFAKNKGITYPLISSQKAQGFLNYIMQKANWHGSIPFLLTFDKQGVAKVVHVGGLIPEQFEQIYTELNK